MAEFTSNDAPINDDLAREGYNYFTPMSTRWIDNDVYGHINNAVYYHYFDTAANEYLINEGGLDISADTVAFIVASSCQYHSPVAHPAKLDIGFRVNRIGRSSVEYGLAVFADGSNTASANGTFTHVFVSRNSGKSISIPENMRSALEAAGSLDKLQ